MLCVVPPGGCSGFLCRAFWMFSGEREGGEGKRQCEASTHRTVAGTDATHGLRRSGSRGWGRDAGESACLGKKVAKGCQAQDDLISGAAVLVRCVDSC